MVNVVLRATWDRATVSAWQPQVEYEIIIVSVCEVKLTFHSPRDISELSVSSQTLAL